MGWPFRAARDADPATAPLAEPGRTAPRHARWELEEGQEIAPGRHVLRRLGGGSRYEVHLAWDEGLFALVVVKLLRPDVAASERARAELRREAELLDRLAHPTLVRGFGAVLEGTHPHLVLEHVEGPTLERLVRRGGALPMDQLLPLALHLVATLHYLASREVVHLDVKPGNVVMRAPPCLIDLSIARPFAAGRALRHAIGTDAYMAPEQCAPGEDGRVVGPAADVWGAGATLFHAAAGRVPFPRPPGATRSVDRAVRFPQLARRPDPLPSSLPAPFVALVEAMLAGEPRDRPTAREAAEALEPLVADVPERLAPSRRRGLVPPR